MISAENLAVEFGGTPLFSNISFQINEKDRIALMGKNGAGKSTLLKILAGERTPTRGVVTVPKDTVVAYLPQHLMTEDGRTVFEETARVFEHLKETEKEIDRLNDLLSTRTDYESEEYMKLIEQVSALSEKFYAIDNVHFDEDIERTLMGLGFERSDFNRPTSDFSGGWRMRIELAKLLLKNPDVLLLDEPTNHLDIESIQWLEDFIRESSKAVVVISHDRKFVDSITTRTIEVTMGRIYDYKASYSQYLELRKERRAQQQKQYEEQQKMIKETQDFIERFKGTYSKTLQVQSRVKMLEKLQIIEVDEEDTSSLRLRFPPSPRSGQYPVIAEGLGKSFGDKNIFKDASFTIERGEKVAFVGRNGEGKSTLVKCIMNELEFDGKLQLGHNVKIGYFAQNQASLLDENLTVFQTIDDIAKGDIRTKIKDMLGAFMFSGEAIEKKVKVLSGGERTRLAILRLLLEPVNLLILDEPTNHLDLKTKDVLKQALQEFDGTLILVSHDRDFLDGLVTKVYEFGHHKVKEHLCGIYEFLETKRMENLHELERKTK
ncbi:MAG: ABC-F family ATP-binding cassette domain-containing protein [Bacteroidales bacterium]|nr:ABC-F family ATP-binding cassette domain-containing protein [Bacteroidales bacterium]